MKTVRNIRSRGESCSCSTCVNKSDSENLSLRRINDLGSRIDRLYLGNYIPLRERKLLQRLVRTRAVYDDIRAKLISDSNVSTSTIGDFSKVSVKKSDDEERSSEAVLEFVNDVDKGAIGSKKLTNCCSCCSCSSKIKIHESNFKRQRPKRRFSGANEYEARERIRAYRERREAYKRKKGVRFKTKLIRSDPCTCTFKLMKKRSKAVLKKIYPVPKLPLFELQTTTDEELKPKRRRISDIARTSYQNLLQSNRRLKEKISEGISKIRDSQTRMQEKKELQTEKSLEKLNQAMDKFTSKVRASAQSIKRIKDKSKSHKFSDKEISFHIIKDSISKFKEDRRRKQIMKDWACEPECIEETCFPEECFLKLKHKRFNRKNYHDTKGINYRIKSQNRRAGEPLRQIDSKTETEKFAYAKTIETQKPVLRSQQKQELKGSRSRGLKNKKTQLDEEPRPDHLIKYLNPSYPLNNIKLESSSPEEKPSHTKGLRIGSSFNIRTYKNKRLQEVTAVASRPYTNSNHYLGIEYKYKKPVNEKVTKKKHLQGSEMILHDTQIGDHALKRCFCTLKLKAKVTKSKMKRPVTKKTMTIEKSALTLNSAVNLTDAQTNTDKRNKANIMLTKANLLPYECEPGVCIPGNCDPYRCIQLIDLREAKRKISSLKARSTKSTFSFTSRSSKPAIAKYVQSMITHRGNASKPVGKRQIKRENVVNKSPRQAVRVGSTFSFNIELYKGSPNTEQKTSELKDFRVLKRKVYQKVKLQDRGFGQRNAGNLLKNTPTQITKKERNARIGTSLRRCFCTLKLQTKKILKNHKMKNFATGMETAEVKPINTANKNTKTKLKYSRPLESFECEPFTCIPGECDPVVCLERINGRNIRLRDVSLNTGRSKIIADSSSNTNPGKSFRSVQVQNKPRYKEPKVLPKTQKPEYIEKKHVSKYPHIVKSRQAVKIGSAFSFEIQFSKNKLNPTEELKSMDPIPKITKARRENKRIKINRLNVAHVETHIQGPWKRDKGSVIGPMIKKCSCTLNLKKKWTHQHFQNKTFRSGNFIFQSPRDQLYKTPSRVSKKTYLTTYKKKSSGLELNSWANFILKPNSQINKETSHIYIQRRVGSENIKGTIEAGKDRKNTLQSVRINQTHPTSLTGHFRRYFYTMNLKVENRRNLKDYDIPYRSGSNKSEKRVLHKLKHYECEPGVCIPGECNPYECQKILAKRLMKNLSIKSGTENSSHAIRSSASQSMSKFKIPKQQTLIQTSTKPQVYGETLKNNQKQAVRIGSSFSFNIEFSKKVSTSHNYVVSPKYHSDTISLAERVTHASKSKGTDKIKTTHDVQSQSALIKTTDIGIFTKPTEKRCFCTLKLQKKGRLHKELNNQQLVRRKDEDINDIIKRRTISRGQNTKKIKPLKLSHALKPYECEPNICNPGECNPYQCLQKIEKRNYFEAGTSPLYHEVASVSSVTINNKNEKMHRSRAVSVTPKKNLVKYEKNYSEFGCRKPLRKAVRVGSSFSFNIEFFKDSSPLRHYAQGDSKENKYGHGPTNENKYSIQYLKKHTNTYTQSSNNFGFGDKQSQIDHFARHASTLTNSFIKRCFCTAELYNTKYKTDVLKSEKEGKSQSFLKKCACLFKKLKLKTSLTSSNLKIQEKSKLDPHYCRTGICVPSECDSHICRKIMGKYRNNNFKTSNADIFETRPASIKSFTTRGKNVEILMNRKKNLSYNRPKHNVKINDDQIAIKQIPNSIKRTENRKKVKTNSTLTFFEPSNIPHLSQVKDQDIKNNIIKRCFCMFKRNGLNKRSGSQRQRKEIDEQNLETVNTKSVMTKEKRNLVSDTLLPYECEPNICIPYQCDPYKCMKLIELRQKNRNSREFGVSTLLPNKYSAYSFTNNKEHQTKNQSTTSKNFHRYAKQTPYKYPKAGQSKQSVRIGSTFSFDIEFFKDQNNNGFHLQKPRKKDYHNNKQLKKRRKNRRKYITNQSQIGNIKMNTNHTQFSNRIMRTQSTMTGSLPAHTLQSNVNTETEFFKTPLLSMVNKSTATLKTPINTHQLNTYECEPFYCIPGECDPYECAKRIKMREERYQTQDTMRPFLKRCFCTLKFQKSLINRSYNIEDEPKSKQRQIYTENKRTSQMKELVNNRHLRRFECEPFYCVPGECDPYECKERIKMREKKNKIQNTIIRSAPRSVGIKQENIQSQRSQATITDAISEIVEKKKFTNNFNKQAVTVGSNFSFNVEFYKENLPQTTLPLPSLDKKIIIKRPKKYLDIDQNTNTTHFRSRGSEFEKYKPQNKSTQKENILKRCFCTLNLNNKQQNMIPFPQTIIVRRATVLHNPKMSSKGNDIAVKQLPTKVDKNHLKKNTDYPCTCIYFSRNGKTIPPEDLKTILPFIPEKFNKTVSKSELPLQNNTNIRKKRSEGRMKVNRGKRITRKTEKKFIHNTATVIPGKSTENHRFLGIKKFISCCVQILTPKTTSKNLSNTDKMRDKLLVEEMITSQSEHQARVNQFMSKPKKSEKTCPYYANYIINLLYQNIDSKQGQGPPGRNIKTNKKQNPKPVNGKLNQKQPIMSHKKTGHTLPKIKNVNRGHVTNEKQSPPLRVHFLKTTPRISHLNNRINVKKLSNSKNKPFGAMSDRVQSYNYCHPCRIKINKEELHKAAGDQLFNQNRKKREVCSGSQAKKPLFEMQLDSGNYDILNKDQVVHNFSKLNTKCKKKPVIEVQLDSKKFNILNKEAVFDKVIKSNMKSRNSIIGSLMDIVGMNVEKACPCRPCVCASHNIIGEATKEVGAQHFYKTSGKPCTCDSLICAKNVPKTKTLNKRHKFKTCVCGSPICHRDPARIKVQKAMSKRMAKRKAKNLKKTNRARANRLKQYSKSDSIRQKEREKLHKKLEKKINGKAPSGVLLADNILDIGKLGITATTDVLRQVRRLARDPKHTYQTLRTIEQNPQLLAEMLQSSKCSDLRATMRRVRLRCFAMRGMQKLKLNLESNPITKYLLHINSKDPSSRVMKNKPKKRVGERLDYTCNFYMATRRKRPFISVYNKCPWFYPHFLSLVHASKQLFDIGLFLLAAVVWSPCILCIELCRACMCCFLCNG